MIYTLIYNLYLTPKTVDRGLGWREEDQCKRVPGTGGGSAVVPHLPSCQPLKGGFLPSLSRPGNQGQESGMQGLPARWVASELLALVASTLVVPARLCRVQSVWTLQSAFPKVSPGESGDEIWQGNPN